MNHKRRSIFSFIALLIFFAAAIVAFVAIKNGKKISGAPELLRSSFEFNSRLGQKLYGRSRLSVEKTVPAGKKPRVNGLLGLKSAIPEDYQILIRNGDSESLLPLSAVELLPKRTHATEFRCIEGWADDISYSGANFSEFMDFHHLGRREDGEYYRFVGLETPDGAYYVSIDMESMLHPQTILATEMNGAPLDSPNGAPLRLVIPIKYGIKSLKRIGKIVFTDERPKDYWAERGYDWYSGL